MSGNLVSGHRARKRFGQNFLVDEGIINHIVRSVHPKESDRIVEIGPGQGAITAQILETCPSLQVIELDRDLVPVLLAQFAKYRDFKIHKADALQFDFSQLVDSEHEQLRVVGNLPYNISTPLIFHLLEQQHLIKDMHFMLQKEVVLRLAAKANENNYGRLGIMAQYYCDVEHLFDVPPESFNPAPKVESAIVRLTPHRTLPYLAKDKKKLETLVKMAFQQRRKTLRNSIKPLLENIQADDIAIDLSKRAENISLEDYVILSNQL